MIFKEILIPEIAECTSYSKSVLESFWMRTLKTWQTRLKTIFTILLLMVAMSAMSQKKPTENINKKMAAVSNLDLYENDSMLHSSIQKGFIPIPIIITEPALGGIGGGLAIGYMHSNRHSLRRNTPPNISGIFGAGTANRSWLVGIAHSHSFRMDHIRYLGVIAKAVVNTTFYEDKIIGDGQNPLSVNLNAWAIIQKLAFRIAETNIFIGPKYTYFHTNNTVDTDHPRLDSLINTINGESSLGMLGIIITYDSRDNLLSPNKGLYVGTTTNYNATFFGGKTDYLYVDLYFKYYLPIAKSVFAGFRFDGTFTEGDVPFYSKPYVSLRGVPALRYQGNEVFVVETQWRWQFYKNWSILGFGGTGKAIESFSDFSSEPWIYNYGVGGRYTLKKLFDLRVGADFAWSNDDFAWYLSVGSSF